MSQYVETPTKTFECGAAIAQHLRVVLSAGKLAAAGITARELGTLESASFASGDLRAVRLRTAAGTVKMVANGIVALGAKVYTAASGQISATQGSGSYPVGDALEAATANNDVIEVLREAHGYASAA